MQQLLQGLSFYSFAEEQLQAARAAATAASSGDGAQAAGQATAPARPEEKGWLAKAEEGLAAWLEAEAARGRLAAAAWRRAAEGGDEQACGDGGAEGGELACRGVACMKLGCWQAAKHARLGSANLASCCPTGRATTHVQGRL